MTPSDQLSQILAAHGVSADTVSLTGPRTLLGEELERLLLDASDATDDTSEQWRARAWDTLRDLELAIDRVEAAETWYRRHLARLRWRREQREQRRVPIQRDRISERVLVEKAWGKGSLHLSRWCRAVPIAGPFPGDGTRPVGVLP